MALIDNLYSKSLFSHPRIRLYHYAPSVGSALNTTYTNHFGSIDIFNVEIPTPTLSHVRGVPNTPRVHSACTSDEHHCHHITYYGILSSTKKLAQVLSVKHGKFDIIVKT